MISLKQLRYALAIEKTLHFKKAAETCNVSQSALSTAINELEKQLDTVIFERNNKQVLVTSNGRLILDKAKIISLELNELIQIAQTNKQPFSSPMTIGVIPTIGPYLLPKVLPIVREKYPDFKLKIIEEQSHVLVDMVKKGSLDAAILALPFSLDGLINFDFWKEDFYWVCHKDEYPNINEEITGDELEMDKLMLIKEGHCLREHVLEACQLNVSNNKEDSDYDSASLHTLIQMVAGKLGTTLVPEMALEYLTNNESEIKAIHFNEPGPHRTIALVIRPNYVRTNELAMLQDIFTHQLMENSNINFEDS